MIDLVICIVNLFFIPIIFVYTHWKLSKKQFVFSLELFFCYGSVVPILFCTTRILLSLVRSFILIEVHLNSSKYTLVAMFVAFLFPYLIEVLKKYISVTCEIKKK